MNIVSTLRPFIDGRRILEYAYGIAGFHRIQASPGFRQAAVFVEDACRARGLNTVTKRYAADGDTRYFTCRVMKEWSCRDARLTCAETGEIWADFSAETTSLIQKSMPCRHTEKALEVLLLDRGSRPEAYDDLDFTGKLVFVREAVQPYAGFVFARGALGLLTDHIPPVEGMRAKMDLCRDRNYYSFWWHNEPQEPRGFGFVLTPEQGEKLAAACREGTAPTFCCLVDSAEYDGEIEVVEACIPGQTEEEVMLVAHLCHPKHSANDNASGVACGIEALGVLHALIRDGVLPAPARGIRAIFPPEFTGTFAWLQEQEHRLGTIRGGLNLDMVAGRQTDGHGPLIASAPCEDTPSVTPYVLRAVLRRAARTIPYGFGSGDLAGVLYDHKPFAAGSDHTLFGDPAIGIPMPMLGQWPDRFYHTSADTIEKLDPNVARFSALCAAAYLYTLAAPSADARAVILSEAWCDLTENVEWSWQQAVTGQPGASARIPRHFDAARRNLATLDRVFPADASRTPAVESLLHQIDQYEAALAARLDLPEAAPDETAGLPLPLDPNAVLRRRFRTHVDKLRNHADTPERRARLDAFERDVKAHEKEFYTAEITLQFAIDGKRRVAAILDRLAGDLPLIRRHAAAAYLRLLLDLDVIEQIN